ATDLFDATVFVSDEEAAQLLDEEAAAAEAAAATSALTADADAAAAGGGVAPSAKGKERETGPGSNADNAADGSLISGGRVLSPAESMVLLRRALQGLRPPGDNDPSVKTIVFSQFTSFDGTMTAAERTRAIEEFSKEDDVAVMLVSLKAIDRVHRIGQMRPVRVYRLAARNTIDERIMNLQESK
ncbi:hypothetical protein HK405_012605, partial [Cladochytrium tenue]